MSLFDPPSRSLRNDPSQDEMVVVRQLASHILNKIQDHLIILPNMKERIPIFLVFFYRDAD